MRGFSIRVCAGTAVLLLAIAGCGGGGSGGGSGSASTPATPPPPAPSQPTIADTSRFLDQATLGVTASDVGLVQIIGFQAYLTQQLAAAPSQYSGFSYTPHTAPATCQYHPATPTDASSLCSRDQYSLFQVQRQFFIHALSDTDQLRQRVAFALSQIFVVSGVEIYEAYGMADYQNMLLNDAFANFRTLLQDVTLSPVMGHYLNMADNDKTNAALGTSPNENYGREVMQLFSIGLYELNPDGSQMLDSTGAPIPTYDQDVIEGFSSVFTGWTFPPLAGAASQWANPINYDGVMVAFDSHHEPGTKLLLNGLTLPAGQTSAQDLQMALDDIFNHPNVGPFIGKQLIQHLVTSNPTPAYIARVSAVFADNGSGVRGDMGAVVQAILTDPEARGDAPAAANFGRLREPALFITAMLRSLGGQSDGVLPRNAISAMGQPMFTPQTVFNFYPPSFVLPGTETLAPEFGIENAATALARANFVNTVIMQGGAKPDPTVTGSTGTTIDLTALSAITYPSGMIAQLNQTLMHGSLSSAASAVILAAVNAQSATDPLAAARTASYLMLSSAQYQVER
ncbi:MAG TPA: DUF1800 domain-containing protein [Steroidobacteraceae bacterium]|nr:DUF1800 domain-containing protein [Steroidobacteraceae bacterium]